MVLRHPEAVCVTQDLDLTPGDKPRSVFASVSLPPAIFHLVVLFGGSSPHQEKLLSFKFVIFEYRCAVREVALGRG